MSNIYETESDEEWSLQTGCRMAARFVMTKYKYENLSTSMPPAILYECNGHVKWQSRNVITGWHGEFPHGPMNELHITFDCRGDKTNLKSVVVERTSEMTWTGLDYRLRKIRMTRLETTQFCRTCHAWHRIDNSPSSAE